MSTACSSGARTARASAKPDSKPHVSRTATFTPPAAYFSGQLPESVPDLVVEHTADGLKVTLDEASRTLPRS